MMRKVMVEILAKKMKWDMMKTKMMKKIMKEMNSKKQKVQIKKK